MHPDERDRLLREGRSAFARGAYFEAHEHWELVWRAATGDERRWLQGLIQIAAALVKLGRGRPDACRRLLGKALPRLADAPARAFGWQLARFARDAAGVLRALEAGEVPDPAALALVAACDEPQSRS